MSKMFARFESNLAVTFIVYGLCTYVSGQLIRTSTVPSRVAANLTRNGTLLANFPFFNRPVMSGFLPLQSGFPPASPSWPQTWSQPAGWSNSVDTVRNGYVPNNTPYPSLMGVNPNMPYPPDFGINPNTPITGRFNQIAPFGPPHYPRADPMYANGHGFPESRREGPVPFGPYGGRPPTMNGPLQGQYGWSNSAGPSERQNMNRIPLLPSHAASTTQTSLETIRGPSAKTGPKMNGRFSSSSTKNPASFSPSSSSSVSGDLFVPSEDVSSILETSLMSEMPTSTTEPTATQA